MVDALAPKWTLVGFIQRLRAFVKEPSDVPAALRIGAFIARVPSILHRTDLQSALRTLRPGGPGSPRYSFERIARLRALCLRASFFGARNTCYVRALTLYRFLDAPDDEVTLHFGIEHRNRGGDRLRGHAWVTLRGELLEGPDEVILGRVREIPITRARANG